MDKKKMSSSMKRLVKYNSVIKAFPTLCLKMRRKLLKNIDPGMIKMISEICLNILKRKIPITKSQYKKLCKCRHLIKKMAGRCKNLQAKKKVLNQNGQGFFLPLIFSLIGPLVGKLIKNVM